jgi:cytochrome P450
MTTLATQELDLFADDVLRDPYPHYRVLRDAGPVVFLEQNGVWAVPRYAEVRHVLQDWQHFTNAQGIAFNDVLNTVQSGSVLMNDPPEHDRLRSLIMRWLSVRRVRTFQEQIEAKAQVLVASLVERGTFDAVTDLAEALPTMVVGELIGLPQQLRDNLLEWGDAVFNCAGPMNARSQGAFAVMEQLMGVLPGISKDDLEPGSTGYEILEHVERGELAHEDAVRLLTNLTSPSIDTTVSGIGTAIHQLALHPDQWALVRDDPSIIPAACNEALRYEAPLQVFSRVANDDWSVDGTTVPAGSRIAVVFGSANRDERKYPDPDRFDITRDAGDHLAFGFGIHHCVGAALARVEIHAAIAALTAQVSRIEVGEPGRRLNNVTRRLSELPVNVSS